MKQNKLRCLVKNVGYIQWNNFKYFRNSIFIHFANVLSWTASHCYISISKQLIKIPNQVFSWSCQQELVAMVIGRSVAFGREEREKKHFPFGLLLLKHKCRSGGACWLICASLWPQWWQMEVSEGSRDYIIVKDIIWSNVEIISEAFLVLQSIGWNHECSWSQRVSTVLRRIFLSVIAHIYRGLSNKVVFLPHRPANLEIWSSFSDNSLDWWWFLRAVSYMGLRKH